jgi:hypothetical protein
MMTGMVHQRVKKPHCSASARSPHLGPGGPQTFNAAGANTRISYRNRRVDANADWG